MEEQPKKRKFVPPAEKVFVTKKLFSQECTLSKGIEALQAQAKELSEYLDKLRKEGIEDLETNFAFQIVVQKLSDKKADKKK